MFIRISLHSLDHLSSPADVPRSVSNAKPYGSVTRAGGVSALQGFGQSVGQAGFGEGALPFLGRLLWLGEG